MAAEDLGKERRQEISFLMDDLKTQIEKDPQAEVSLKAMEIRFKELLKAEAPSQ